MEQLLRQESSRAGLSLGPPTLSALSRFVSLLVHWGQRLNLTARPEPATLIQRHLADAFFLAARLGSHLGQRPPALLDAGSGAGLPGLVLALLIPDLQLTLVEARERKCAFLRTAAHELGLPVTVLAGRLEHLQLPPQDIACSRATWAPSEWLQRSLPLLTPGGLVAAFLAGGGTVPSPPPLLLELERLAYTLSDGTPRLLLLCQRQP